MKIYKPLLLIVLIIVLDQVLKVYIKTTMYIGQEIVIFPDWFILHFTENYGIAFGLEFGGRVGKIFLTFFRITAVTFIGYYMVQLAKRPDIKPGLIYSIALIFAGAMGNIIDSVFYGVIFGYDTFFHGRVVDMFYFPIFRGTYPDWFPLVGGDRFLFFRPVFNLADAAISVGVGIILLFHRKFLSTI